MAKIDVIIPMYNASSMISETIESVEASDFNDFKIIIVDDGSTDDSCEIVVKLGKKYDNIYYYKKKMMVFLQQEILEYLSQLAHISAF